MKIFLASMEHKFTNPLGKELIQSSRLGLETLAKGKTTARRTRMFTYILPHEFNLIVSAGDYKYVGKAAPNSGPESNYEGLYITVNKIIGDLREKLKKPFDNVHAFITGGVARNPSDNLSDNSFSLLEELYEALMKNGISPTVIAGQKNTVPAEMNSSVVNGDIYLQGRPIEDIITPCLCEQTVKSFLLPKKEFDIEFPRILEAQLNRRFDFVELNTGNTPIEVM